MLLEITCGDSIIMFDANALCYIENKSLRSKEKKSEHYHKVRCAHDDQYQQYMNCHHGEFNLNRDKNEILITLRGCVINCNAHYLSGKRG